MKLRTAIISDVHIGMRDTKIKILNDWLKTIDVETLILNGDIVDTWALKKGDKLYREHLRFARILMKKMQNGTEVIYLRGNHDDFLHHIIPLNITLDNFKLKENHIHKGLNGKRYFILHGDVFDKNMPRFMYRIGSIGYDLILWINRVYNKRRTKKGKPYYSISKQIKHNTKFIVSFLAKFQEQVVTLAKSKSMDGVICGHIHTPKIEMLDGIIYMNSGDWVENTTALIEDENGKWSVYDARLEKSIITSE